MGECTAKHLHDASLQLWHLFKTSIATYNDAAIVEGERQGLVVRSDERLQNVEEVAHVREEIEILPETAIIVTLEYLRCNYSCKLEKSAHVK